MKEKEISDEIINKSEDVGEGNKEDMNSEQSGEGKKEDMNSEQSGEGKKENSLEMIENSVGRSDKSEEKE